MKKNNVKFVFLVLTVLSFAVAITLGLTFERQCVKLNENNAFFEVFKSFDTIEWNYSFILALIKNLLIVCIYYLVLFLPIILLLSISIARAVTNKGKNIAWIPVSLVVSYHYFVIVITISLKHQTEISVSYLIASSIMYLLAFCLIFVHRPKSYKSKALSESYYEYGGYKSTSSSGSYVYTDEDMDLDILTGIYDPTSDNYIDPSGM